ncbi:MAG: Fic family protein [Syntrophomonadaceae bacterium]|nr:Fic family protein [Syntrophomonadaceae bacterium]
MREFDYRPVAEALQTEDIVGTLSAIHECRREQSSFIAARPYVLNELQRAAATESAAASNRIEGISAPGQRVSALVKQETAPQNRSEIEIAGYRDVLNTIHENYYYLPPHPEVIISLHRDLFRYSGSPAAGRFKKSDNPIAGHDAQGGKISLPTIPADETPSTMARLCAAYLREAERGEIEPLLLIPVFVLDFLCIHPFGDGNGRMSRLLTLLLLNRSGYAIGKYISLETLIEQTQDAYYAALQSSAAGWYDNANRSEPFVTYMLGIILNAYQQLVSHIAAH